MFTGAPLLSLMAASRLVDNVYLATPEDDKHAAEKTAVFSKLKSIIWVPKEDMEKYIAKSDAVLIGPGMMRYSSENTNIEYRNSKHLDSQGEKTRQLTKILLEKFPEKKWVIDGGSLQVMEADWIPKMAVVTPNKKEFEMLFENSPANITELAQKYNCIISYKGPTSYVSDGETTYEINGGNAGLTKGGTGDVQAGITVGLLAKNQPLLSAAAASFVIKKTAEYLYEKVGFNYNADDVAENVYQVLKNL